ncbi:MAG: 4Fe-4S binding protein [Candidatus Pacearchaeota archaeon]
MTKTWYPKIDYKKCIGCLACVNFCKNKVFRVKDGKPIVVKPENCVEFCRGCQKGACQNNAILFPGDNGWNKK